jgi:hypothetical protein
MIAAFFVGRKGCLGRLIDVAGQSGAVLTGVAYCAGRPGPRVRLPASRRL